MGRHWRWWVGVVVILAALYGAVGVLAAWVHLPARLSDEASVCDIEQRADLSADGHWLATVWIQGRKMGDGCVSRGPAVLRWATTEASQTGWSERLSLPLPGDYSTGCFVHADVALSGSQAYIAATVWAPCDNLNADSAIAYYTCDLQSGVCNPATIVTSELGSNNLRFSEAQIALDSLARPHIVYGRGTHALAEGKLYYTRNLGAGWITPRLVSPPNENAYRPALAASNGRIHIVWERHRDYEDPQHRMRQIGDVRYRYTEEAGDFGTVVGYSYPTNLVEPSYPIPAIAALGERVVLTWNVCADVDGNPPCNKFYQVYTRSNANGNGFLSQPLEVGTEIELRFISLSSHFYWGSDGDDNPAGEYAAHLNSAIALDPQGFPYLAWQIQEGSGYVITTTHAISETFTNFTWATGAQSQSGDGSDNRVYPALELTTEGSTQALHLLYMKTWRQGVWGRSQIFYDASSPTRPTVHLNYTERTSGLPSGRAQVITAYVQKEGAVGVAGVPVVFTTTLGSFSHTGYGMPEITTLTNAQGEATVTLYSNQVGVASVSVWADSVENMTWDTEEPGAVLTQTWFFVGTPALTVSSAQVMGGQWISATAFLHPFTDLTDLEGDGQPRDYFLWWCPVVAPEDPPSQQVGEDFQVDVDTWARSLMVEVPYGAEGTYRLETHSDSSGDPCESPDSLVAASPFMTATSEYPPGALITIEEGRPYPGDTLAAMLRQHPSSTYDVWWCTNSGKHIAQIVAVDVNVDSSAVVASLRVPLQASGVYHLESHTNALGATCGNLSTYVASSSLLWPRSRVFLPLVLRNK